MEKKDPGQRCPGFFDPLLLPSDHAQGRKRSGEIFRNNPSLAPGARACHQTDMIPVVLIVEDDADIRALVARYLKQNNIDALVAEDAHEMDRLLSEKRVSLIVLDIMLPGEDGLSICRRLRATSNIPIIMLTAQKDDIERIIGLEMGADDYVTKPFNPRELLARIRAVLRRLGDSDRTLPQTKSRIFRFADWVLDTGLRRLHDPNGTRILLTGAEFDLLVVFCERPGRVLSRETLIELSQGREAHPSERSIDILVSRLRRKIETNPKDPTLLHTIRSGGYRLTSEVIAE
jgi:two-component system OmpR family response regulator